MLGTERFLREIEIAASLQHPHILPLFDSGQVLVEHPSAEPLQPRVGVRHSPARSMAVSTTCFSQMYRCTPVALNAA
jgi:serine/threonine protein kinase